MENLVIWNQVKSVPAEAKKPIQGGRLKGKTDINPMWRIKKLTEVYGPCGSGWWYTIDKQWTEKAHNEEVAAFCNITLYTKDSPYGIPGTGGSAFIAMESKGPYMSDECHKMALTDALSVACKALGVGADVYWEQGSKYDTTPDKPQKSGAEEKIEQVVQQGTAIKQTPFRSKTAVSDKPEKISEADNKSEPRYICEDCSLEIAGYTAKTGDNTTTYTAKEVFEKTKIAHNRHLCLSCAKKAAKAKSQK